VAIDGGAAYVEVQARLIGAVETPGADVGVAVPACPGWSVHDVLAYDGKERRLGEGPEGATLTADRHELVRVLAGRRTRGQILELAWDGDPTPFVDVLSEYGPVWDVGID